ncbi:MAG: hypothetical protein JETT_3589 [Candidatus Jettenia ecosi]|uniref:Uncharacterized protein n=1 Tax=Candidatus Jettenia ecosi TaxID=2494326 RepID=A0A533Q6D8_9BACT|nr:MAG: hypothetical protein JETT_3589 [Candidatus Jettenia ecosi]
MKAICSAYLLRWTIKTLFNKLKQYLHFGSYHCRKLKIA